MSLFIRNIFTSFVLITAVIFSKAQSGNISVNPPNGGFNIDGYLQRQDAGGDWLAGPGGNTAGTFVLDNNGNSLYAIHYIDRWNDDLDNVFFKGKFGDDPSTMKWILKKSQDKGDINHVLGFLSTGPSGVWIFLAGDRFSSGGTTYLDFELTQKPIVRIGAADQGTFYTFGEQGGRTVGDLVVSLKFDKNASKSEVNVYMWQTTSSGYGYFLLNTSPVQVYSAVNSNIINVPYGAFGATTYQPYTFGEIAINLGALTASCSGPSTFRTFWVYSKSNSSNNANLIDFAEATQIPINPNYSVSVDYLFRDLVSAQITTTVTPGTNDDYNFLWLPITPLTGSLNDAHIPDPLFTTGPDDYCLSYLYELYVYRKTDCCLVSIIPIVLNSPCKIGKPINPDIPNLESDKLKENPGITPEIQVYPNPAKGQTRVILSSGIGQADMDLFNINGQRTRQWLNVNSEVLDLNKLSPGLYLLKVTSKTNGRIYIKKIMVGD